ncbi:MAG: prolipoprotein diacylglyceryl transferase [Candidatus Kapabacteria bacterium]|nr:prolipoprotein diacylglyceryl transferase [Ignavibacteriota bacterium]MCW5885026.1 prolipoprotein diacylglyceryl transferase [Candidatus Kapabacteria bacterium]
MELLNNYFGFFNYIGFTLSILLLYKLAVKYKFSIITSINLYFLFISLTLIFGTIGYALIYKSNFPFDFDVKNHSHLGSTILIFFVFSILFNQLWFKNIKLYLDLFILPGAFFQVIAKTGCYYGQCCSGIVEIPGLNINLPLQFAEAIFLFVNTLIIASVIFFNKLSIGSGKIFYLYILLFSIERFFAEFYRDESINGFFGIRISFIFLVIMILFSLLIIIKKDKKGNSLSNV